MSNFIDGVWREGGGLAINNINPSNGENIGDIICASNEDVDSAVKAARNAFDENSRSAWPNLPRNERIDIINRYGEILKEKAGDISELIALDTGKPYWECKTEAASIAGKIALSIRAYQERTPEFNKPNAFGELSLTHHAYGVMAVLGPFNFPGHLPNGHIVPALLAGNTIVFKPSELAPLAGNFMAKALQEAGIPKGVFNLVNGARDTGAALLGAKGLNGVLFTGSEKTGTYIHKTFGGRPEIILALEMGGNNPLIVWNPCEIEAAADMIIHSAFITTGQRCSCARRIILPEGDFGDAVLAKVIEKTNDMIIGAPDLENEAFIGPLINEKSAENMLEYSQNLIRAGGKEIIATTRHELGGAFVMPSLIDMTNANEAADEECFAPIAQVYRVKNFEDAIVRANQTRFGLSSGLVCDDEWLWNIALNRLRAGLINRNRPTTGASGELPFGGPGLSGNGRPSAYYAADYCAYPVAQQNAATAKTIEAKGFKA